MGQQTPQKYRRLEKAGPGHRDWLKATNDTGSGNPSKSSAEKGKRLLDELSQKLASFYVELAQADVTDLYQKTK